MFEQLDACTMQDTRCGNRNVAMLSRQRHEAATLVMLLRRKSVTNKQPAFVQEVQGVENVWWATLGEERPLVVRENNLSRWDDDDEHPLSYRYDM